MSACLSIAESQWKTLFKFINETSSLRPETFVQGHFSEDVPNQQQGNLWFYNYAMYIHTYVLLPELHANSTLNDVCSM